MFQFNPYGVYGLAAVAASWALAVLLYRVGTSGSVARKLSLLLAIEGFTLVTSSPFDLLFVPAVLEASWYPVYFKGGFILHTLGDGAMLALYPPFLAAALRTNLTRPFGTTRIRIILAAISFVLFIAIQFSRPEISATLLYLMLSSVFAFALVASIHAWHIAAPGGARDRARTFVFAFGFRDLCWGFIYLTGVWMISQGRYFEEPPRPDLINLIYTSGTMVAVPLIAYGILRPQLFDIDLRIRWTIKQSTLAAVFVTFIYLISEGADRFLSTELGNMAGLLASALVVFFLAPLQRFAERVASVAMPNTENTPEYAAFRKLQVYEEAVSEALHEGGISDKERSLLNRLRDTLAISPTDAETLERELQMGAVAH